MITPAAVFALVALAWAALAAARRAAPRLPSFARRTVGGGGAGGDVVMMRGCSVAGAPLPLKLLVTAIAVTFFFYENLVRTTRLISVQPLAIVTTQVLIP